MQNDMTNNQYRTETVLSEARMLNSDLGRHVKNCSFSTNLTGRFYQNNSLESHKARAHRIQQMKSKRRQLERSLEMEEKKILFLETKLKERQLQRLQEKEMKIKTERAVIKIQSQIRRMLSVDRCQVLQVESKIMEYVVRFLQALYRGGRDRKRVHRLRMTIIRHRKEELAAIQMQSHMRRFMAIVELGRKFEERKIRHDKAACLIQARIRGFQSRQFVKALIERSSATKIQSHYRGMIGRRIRDTHLKAKRVKKEKAKRIPLHERRYSTYSVDSSRKDSISRRRFTEIASSLKSSNERRLTGLEILRLVHAKKDQTREQKENTATDMNSKNNDNKKSDAKRRTHIEDKCLPSSRNEEGHGHGHEHDKIRLSRQKAAARAAKLKRQSQNEKEIQLKHAKDRKIELDQLELKRRNMMKQRMAVKKERALNLSRKIDESSMIDNSKKDDIDTCKQCEQQSNISTNITVINENDDVLHNAESKQGTKATYSIVLDDFDCDFEEEFCENEFDLDDMDMG
jgi:hypothetical protein